MNCREKYALRLIYQVPVCIFCNQALWEVVPLLIGPMAIAPNTISFNQCNHVCIIPHFVPDLLFQFILGRRRIQTCFCIALHSSGLTRGCTRGSTAGATTRFDGEKIRSTRQLVRRHIGGRFDDSTTCSTAGSMAGWFGDRFDGWCDDWFDDAKTWVDSTTGLTAIWWQVRQLVWLIRRREDTVDSLADSALYLFSPTTWCLFFCVFCLQEFKKLLTILSMLT